MAIERLQIRNFQRHENLKVVLDPQVTAIVGPSDAGKSSLLRAIRWLALNRPRGDGFIRTGEKQADANLWVDDHKLRRHRGKENNYKIDDTVLEAFGTDVPRQVSDLLSMDETNFAGQHDPPFWFSLTPGEVARKLNEIIDLSVIDKTQADLAAKWRAAEAERNVAKSRLSQATEQRDGMSYVPAMAARLDELTALEGENERRARDLARVVELGRQANNYGRAVEDATRGQRGGQELKERGAGLLESEERIDRLGRLLADGERLTKEVGVKVPSLGELKTIKAEATAAQENTAALDLLLELAVDKAAQLRRLSQELLEAKEELNHQLGGRCPVCEQEWDGL